MKLKTLVYLSLITLVASLSLAAHAQTFSVIHAFTGGINGTSPNAGVTIKGNALYGTTVGAGRSYSTVYQLTHVGSNWFEIPLSFLGIDVGYAAMARVVFGPDGHLYGTTSFAYTGSGLVFDLIAPSSFCKTAACYWTENVLHLFTGPPDGAAPGRGDLIWDRQGNIYGTTSAGGTANAGTVFQMTKSEDNWTETPVYSFLGGTSDGSVPFNGVVMDSNGNLFGTTLDGGMYGYGTVFELTYIPQVGWKETILYNFTGGSDGSTPFAGLTLDGSGNLYGATGDGGMGGGGTLFELAPSGNTYTFNLLYTFSGQPGGNCGPGGTLTTDSTGNLYGTTVCDGPSNVGNIFALANTENGWVYTSLHDFTGGNDGSKPISNVTIDTDGTLYGTASQGGANGAGTVWMIKP